MRAAVTAAAACRDCAAGHDHCHETLVVHADGTVECLAAASCDRDEEVHPLVVDCTELGPPCRCADG